MLEFEWPDVWSPDTLEAVREGLQRTFRRAMSRSTGSNSQIRGSVTIEDIQFGSQPPDISLSSVQELQASHTAVMISVKYSGDATITLKGLQINLDTTTTLNDRGEEANHTVPFYCPFQMTLKDVVLDGMILVESRITAVVNAPKPFSTPMASNSAGTAGLQTGLRLPSHVLSATTSLAHHRHDHDARNASAESTSLSQRGGTGGRGRGGVGSLGSALHSMFMPHAQLESSPSMPLSTTTASTPARVVLHHTMLPSTGTLLSSSHEHHSDATPSVMNASFATNTSAMTMRGFRSVTGLGLLAGAGGKRRMRPPDALLRDGGTSSRAGSAASAASCAAADALPSAPPPSATLRQPAATATNSATATASPEGMSPLHASTSTAASSDAQQHTPPTALPCPMPSSSQLGFVPTSASSFTFSDIVSKRVTVARKVVRVQLYGDPIKSFRIESNFGAVPGADQKIEAQLRNILIPAIDRMKTEGIEIVLP